MPGLYSYEIFNEPEGMGPNGWATYRTTEAYIQKSRQLVRRRHPHRRSERAGHERLADVRLLLERCAARPTTTRTARSGSAGGKQNGTLDFYEVHYYTSNGTSDSCFMHPASYWGLDKKLVMGEFYAATTDGVTQDDTTRTSTPTVTTARGPGRTIRTCRGPSMQTPMQDVYTAHTSDVGSCP